MLSKSKIKLGFQCPLALYNIVFNNFLAQYSKESKKLFSMGNEIGDFARKRFPKGITIRGVRKEDKIKKTKTAITNGAPVFEASFDYQDILIQVDVLVPEDNGWSVKEVKSGTSVKEEYLLDLAIQCYVLRNQRDIKIVDYSFLLVNKNSLDEENFLMEENVSKQVNDLCDKITPMIKDLILIAKNKKVPEVKLGSKCFFPYRCPFFNDCWKGVPKNKTVLVLPSEMKDGYLRQKKLFLKDTGLPDDLVSSLVKNKVYFNKERVQSEIKNIEDPVFLRIFTRLIVFPENGKTPYTKVPWGFSVSLDNENKAFIFERTPSEEEFFNKINEIVGNRAVIVFNLDSDLNDFVSKDKKQILDLKKVLNLNLIWNSESDYSFYDYCFFVLRERGFECSSFDFKDFKEETNFLLKEEKSTVLKEKMIQEVSFLEKMFFSLKKQK